MPPAKTAEGFYWVQDKARSMPPFVAHRFAQAWWEPGCGDEIDGRALDILSARLEPPSGEVIEMPRKHMTDRTIAKL